jgi:DNA-binding MarR family transcriptional regulator
MGMEPTSLSRTLKTMEEKNLIRREEDKIDKRIVRIFLTEEGLKARYIARDVVFELNNKLSSKFSQEQIENFHEVMIQIDKVMDDEFYINSNL